MFKGARDISIASGFSGAFTYFAVAVGIFGGGAVLRLGKAELIRACCGESFAHFTYILVAALFPFRKTQCARNQVNVKRKAIKRCA